MKQPFVPMIDVETGLWQDHEGNVWEISGIATIEEPGALMSTVYLRVEGIFGNKCCEIDVKFDDDYDEAAKFRLALLVARGNQALKSYSGVHLTRATQKGADYGC